MLCLSPVAAAQDEVAEAPAAAALALHAGVAGRDWPQFRGIGAAGVADGHALPADWDIDTGRNVRWRTAIPGLSHASPIVFDDRVYVVTAVAEGIDPELRVGLYGDGDSAADLVEHSFRVLCLDRADGSVLWDREAITKTPQFARHTKATHANSTPATDGSRVVALFATGGLFCYDRDGELLWQVELGPLDVGPHNSMDLQWGFASSPIVAQDKVIVQADVKEGPFLAAYDIASGALVWKVTRDDLTGWSTPTACAVADGDYQIVVNGCRHMGGYHLADGGEAWRMAGGGGIPIPTPIAVADLVYLTSNHRPIAPDHPLSPIFAVRAAARGDLGVPRAEAPGEQLAWMQTRHGSYLQTPVVYGDFAFVGKDNGVVSAFAATTGEPEITVRLGTGNDGFSASPVAGDGKLFFTSETGAVYVLAADADLEVLATLSLGEICMATPAIASGMMLFRTRDHVLAVGADP